MKAPEKLYCMATEGGFYITTIKPEPPSTKGVEYIRKDALLEWAKDTKIMLESDIYITADVRHGAIWQLEEVINKIKSL